MHFKFACNAGGVRTLIALHHGRKTKSESLASCCGRVNISSGSKIARINVECNRDSLSVAIPSKVKKCWQAFVTPVTPPWQIRCQEVTEEIQKESKLQPCPRIFSFDSIKFTSYLTGNQPLTCKLITKRQLPSYTNYFSCHTLKGVNTGFTKGEALRLLRPNSSRSTFNKKTYRFSNMLKRIENT